MYPIKNNIYFIKVFLKVSLSITCYLAFTIYTVPVYKNVRAHVEEKMNTKIQNIIIGETSLIVEIRDTPESRQRGLSGREPLRSHEGMLFVFEELGDHRFWMKDMKFSIDIIWLNEYGEVIHYAENISPDTYPTLFNSPQQSKYVLETQAGFVKKEAIKLYDKIDLY